MRVLLIVPEFYDYHTRIVTEMRAQGHEVLWFLERPPRLIFSVARNLPGGVGRRVFGAYQKRILRRSATFAPDLVLVIRGVIIEPWFLRAVRARWPKAGVRLYEWDSVGVVDFRPLLPLVDKAWTFDPVDSEVLGIEYRPLFFTDEYRLEPTQSEPQYDLAFVGSFHEARYVRLRQLAQRCEQQGLRLLSVLYLARLDYWKLKILRRLCPKQREITHKKLDRAAVIGIYASAAGILDIENTKQTGLTMRTFEALATGRTLLTTNPYARRLLDDFADQVLQIDDDGHLPARSDIRRKHATHPQTLGKYSLSNWARCLLE